MNDLLNHIEKKLYAFKHYKRYQFLGSVPFDRNFWGLQALSNIFKTIEIGNVHLNKGYLKPLTKNIEVKQKGLAP